jgi:hypothetical protein
MDLLQRLTPILKATTFRRATFGGVRRGPVACPWLRIALRPVELRGEHHLQFAYFDARKNTTHNFQGADIETALAEIVQFGFARIHLSTSDEEIDIRLSKKGKVMLSRSKTSATSSAVPKSHNRVKDVPLPEAEPNRLLEVMGIQTQDGRIRPTMRAKYTQINEFLKLLTHVLDDAGLRSLGRPLEILDCGCGLSYLTLAVHHYLNTKLNIPTHILGVDVNEEVIRKSIERSDQLGTPGLAFACDRIGGLTTNPDIVLALHACDTSTDDAIAQAIRSEAKLLLSVPCCHHHLNDQMRSVGPAVVLRPLLRHGILHQRTADLVTDAFRALILRIMGYRTEVIEFISPEHTARNLMIRAVRGMPLGESVFVDEYQALCQFWGVRPYLEQLLADQFQDVLASRHSLLPYIASVSTLKANPAT